MSGGPIRNRRSYTSSRYNPLSFSPVNRRLDFSSCVPSYRRTRYTNIVASRRISKIARQVVLSTAEPKHKSLSIGKIELYHNTLTGICNLNAANATYMPALGSQDNQRVGDRIFMRGFSVRCLFGQKWDRPNVTWRIICVAQRAQSGVLPYNILLDNISGNGMLDKINDDRVTVLLDKYMKPLKSSVITATAGVEDSKEFTFARQFWIPRKKMYKFETDGGAMHNDQDLWMYVIPYDAFGSLITDNIGYVQVWLDINYKDP